RRETRQPSRSRTLRPCVLLPGRGRFNASRPGGTVADAHRQALNGATPCRRSGCLPPPRGACLTRAVAAASVGGALSAVVSSIRTTVSATALPSVGPHHPTRER